MRWDDFRRSENVEDAGSGGGFGLGGGFKIGGGALIGHEQLPPGSDLSIGARSWFWRIDTKLIV